MTDEKTEDGAEQAEEVVRFQFEEFEEFIDNLKTPQFEFAVSAEGIMVKVWSTNPEMVDKILSTVTRCAEVLSGAGYISVSGDDMMVT